MGGKLRDRRTLETRILLDNHTGLDLLDVPAMRVYGEHVILEQLRIVQALRPNKPPLIPGLPGQ